MLEAFPRLPNGKKNLQALEIPKNLNPVALEPESALSETEKEVLKLWIEILGRNPIRKEDSFFEVGGNSLLIIKLHARLNEQLGVNITISDLFRYPTCASQAKFIDMQRNESKAPTPLELLQKLAEGSIDLETIKRAFK